MSAPASSTARAIALYQGGETRAARELAQTVLAEEGESAALRHLLGVICCRDGELGEGIEHLEQAAALAPRSPEISIMLMRAQIDAGRPGDALLRKFGAEDLPAPVLLALWRTRAEAAHRAGNMDQEADALDRVVLLDSADAASRLSLIALLLSLDRPAAALAHLDSLSRSGANARLRSSALTGLRRLDEAIALESALLKADPRDREAWLSLVLLADRKGDAGLLAEMIAVGKRDHHPRGEVDFARALLAKHEGRSEEALELARASEVPGDPARRFGLIASLADRLEHSGEAFDAAVAKAAATPDVHAWRQRGEAHRAGLERVAAAITKEWAAWPPAPPLDRPSPAFLVGFPRSGTTLLDTFLMGHPRVVVLEEELTLDAAARILGEQINLDKADASTIEKARAAYFTELDRHLVEGQAGRLVIDKLPLAMTGAAIIHRLFPGAKIIFAQRHPADSVLSNFLQLFRLNDAMANFLDIEDAAKFYDVAMRLWVRSHRLLELDVRDLVYEELVDDPGAALRPLVEWLGLPWHEELLDHRRTAAARGAIVTPSYDQVTQPLHRRAAGRWRRYARQLDPVLPILDPWARQFGYGPLTASATKQ